MRPGAAETNTARAKLIDLARKTEFRIFRAEQLPLSTNTRNNSVDKSEFFKRIKRFEDWLFSVQLFFAVESLRAVRARLSTRVADPELSAQWRLERAALRGTENSSQVNEIHSEAQSPQKQSAHSRWKPQRACVKLATLRSLRRPADEEDRQRKYGRGNISKK